jgi:hypothetical protein
MVDHNVVRLDITMHDSLAVAEIQGLEELKDIESDINIVELGVQASEIGVVDMFEDQRRCLALCAVMVSWDAGKSRRADGTPTCESRTTSSKATTLGPPARF